MQLQIHNYNTRQSSSEGFSLPSISTNFKKNFLTFDGIKFWNSLPIELKKRDNKHHFVKQMKYFLMNNFQSSFHVSISLKLFNSHCFSLKYCG